MNSQSPDKNNQAVFAQNINKLFASQRAKFLLFAAALIIAMIVSAVVSDFFSGMENGILTSLILFPAGIILIIVWIVPGLETSLNEAMVVIYILGAQVLWGVYLGMILVGTMSKDLRTSKTFFLVFVLLLVLNVGGCAARQ